MSDTTITTERPEGALIKGAGLSPYTIPRLDWRVRIENAGAFMVTHRLEGLALGKDVWTAETFSKMSEALDFHEEIASGVRTGTAGVVIALRADGSVIGEIPTRRQERAILEKARRRGADLDAELMLAQCAGRVAKS